MKLIVFTKRKRLDIVIDPETTGFDCTYKDSNGEYYPAVLIIEKDDIKTIERR